MKKIDWFIVNELLHVLFKLSAGIAYELRQSKGHIQSGSSS